MQSGRGWKLEWKGLVAGVLLVPFRRLRPAKRFLSNSLQKRAYIYCTHSKMRESGAAPVHIYIFAGTCLLIFYFGRRGRVVNSKLNAQHPQDTQAACVCRRVEAKRLPRSITLVTKQWNACGGPCVCVCQPAERGASVCVGRRRRRNPFPRQRCTSPAANARKIVKHDKALLSQQPGLGCREQTPKLCVLLC